MSAPPSAWAVEEAGGILGGEQHTIRHERLALWLDAHAADQAGVIEMQRQAREDYLRVHQEDMTIIERLRGALEEIERLPGAGECGAQLIANRARTSVPADLRERAAKERAVIEAALAEEAAWRAYEPTVGGSEETTAMRAYTNASGRRLAAVLALAALDETRPRVNQGSAEGGSRVNEGLVYVTVPMPDVVRNFNLRDSRGREEAGRASNRRTSQESPRRGAAMSSFRTPGLVDDPPALCCTECGCVFTQSQIAAESPEAWGHPCPSIAGATACESFRTPVDEARP